MTSVVIETEPMTTWEICYRDIVYGEMHLLHIISISCGPFYMS